MAEPLAVYVHWPFCRSKCPYCDFNSHVRDGVDHARWRRALLAELDHAAGELADRTVTSVFFGGGTPSLMAPSTVAALLERIAGHWALAGDLEVTLEANPTSVEAGRFADFRAAGINRVSLGIQALNDADLAFLGREHDTGAALAAIEMAGRHFPRFSFDLIYARPGQSVAAWRSELARALDLAGDHLSLYQLTIERGTPFYAAHRTGTFTIPDPDAAAALYDVTGELTDAAGLPAYEISNYAAAGGACRHNLAYWRYQDYVGIGPGAHGRVSVAGRLDATERIPGPEAWLAAAEASGHGMRRCEPVAPQRMVEEMLMMGLRLADGLRHDAFRRRTGRPLAEAVSASGHRRLVAAGYLDDDGIRLRATARGRPLLNALLIELLR